MSALSKLQKQRDAILQLAAKHGAGKVRVIGSVARGDDDNKSDIDLLVEFEAGRSLLDHAALIDDLQTLLNRKVDIASERGLRPNVRQRVIPEAIP
jgi:predicted nucleotidyltransferase